MLRPKLNRRQQLFVTAYIGEAAGNATQAAILAGYSAKTARQIGSELLTKPDIADAIQAHDSRETKRKILSADERDAILSEIATDPSPLAGRADKIRAIAELNKCSGRHISRHEVGGIDGQPLVLHVLTGVPQPEPKP